MAAGVMALLLASCGASQHSGTHPADMSAKEHEQSAENEDRLAEGHADQYNPSATDEREHCTGGRDRVCWTATVNPTRAHIATADEHREAAAQHRAASQALRDAEAQACAGLTDEDRDMSPFAHNADIQSVEQFRETKRRGRQHVSRDAGATVVFRAQPGLTTEWLQRLVDCHLARNAALGDQMEGMQYCPLAVRGARAAVRSVGNGFAVDVSADSPDAVAEIWRRAQVLDASRTPDAGPSQ
jgi:hypothetical protein